MKTIVSSEKSVKYKLVLGFLLVIVLFVSIGVISLWELHSIGNLTEMIYKHTLVVSNAALNADINMTKMHLSLKDVILSKSTNELIKATNEVNKYEHLVYDKLDIIRERIIGIEGQDLERRTRQLFADWKPIRDEVLLLFNSGRRDEAASITKRKEADHVEKLEDKMMELTTYTRKRADVFMQLAERNHNRVENFSIILVMVGVFLSSIISFFTIKYVLKVEKAMLHERNELHKALSKIRTLSGLLPICASCKKIRDDKGYWKQLELYIRDHSEAEFSHSICPSCADKLYGDLIKDV